MKKKSKIGFFLKIILTILIFWVILQKVDFSELAGTFTSPDYRFLIGAFLLVIPNFALKFYKWNYLLNSCAISADYWTSSKSYLAGLSIGMLTPARAGEVSRVFFLPGQNKLAATGIVVIDKIMDLLGIILWSLIGARIFLPTKVFIFLLFLVIIGNLSLLCSKYLSNKVKPFLKSSGVTFKIGQILSALGKISPKTLTIGSMATILMFMVVLLQCHLLVLAFYHQPVAFHVTLFAYPLVILANIFPLTIGGLGVREGVAVYCLSFFDLSADIAVTATLYLFLINVVMPALLGYVIILRQKN